MAIEIVLNKWKSQKFTKTDKRMKIILYFPKI